MFAYAAYFIVLYENKNQNSMSFPKFLTIHYYEPRY